MKLTHTLFALALAVIPAFGETTPAPAADSYAGLPALSKERFEGSLTMMYRSFYSGRGLVATQAVAEGEGCEAAAFKAKYDFGRKGAWSYNGMVAYTAVSSGHTLYGNPTFGRQAAVGLLNQRVPNFSMLPPAVQEQYIAGVQAQHIKQCNIENEFVVSNELKYESPSELWNVSFGHDFIHGGILGVMAKHYRDQGSSSVNEVFIHPEITPTKWLSLGCTTRFSFSGIRGWWFEPTMNLRMPILPFGTTDGGDIKLLAMLQLGMSSTADYFRSHYFACDNGSQAYWVKLSTPYFLTKDLIVTPSVSFNWAGRGAMKANTKSEFRAMSGDSGNKPFRNFAVVSDISVTYRF